MKTKDKRKQGAYKIKIIVDYKAEPSNSDSYTYIKVQRKKKAKNDDLTSHKHQVKKTTKHKGYHCYCVL